LYNNALAHPSLATQENLNTWAFNVLITQDLAPSEYYLFPGLKKLLIGRHFFIAAAETWWDGQYSEFFFEWLAKFTARG
jgi:hypothetical protein